MDQLAAELDMVVGLNCNYLDLLDLFATSRSFFQLSKSPLFWQWKAMKDFKVTAGEFAQINLETKNDRETYIRIAGERGVPIPGAERYGYIVQLIREAATRLTFYPSRRDIIFEKFFSLHHDYEVFKILGEKGRKDLILKLGNTNITTFGYAIRGALTVNNYALAFTLVHLGSGSYSMILKTAAKTNNYIVIDKLDKDVVYCVGPAIRVAAKRGNMQMLEYLKKFGYVDPDEILTGAISGGNLSMITYAISLGASSPHSGLTTAIKNHNLEMVKYIITRFPIDDLDNLLTLAIRYDDILVVEYLLSLGAEIREDPFTVVNSIPMVRFLLEKEKLPGNDAGYFIINKYHYEIFYHLFTYFSPPMYVKYANYAASMGALPILKFLYSKGIELSQYYRIPTYSRHPNIAYFVKTKYNTHYK